MSPTRFIIQALAAAAAFAMVVSTPARAGMIGADVVSRYYNSGGAIGSAVRIATDGAPHVATPWFSVTVTDSQVIYQFNSAGLWAASSPSLNQGGLFISNGNLLTFTGPRITSVQLNPATNMTGLTAANLTFNDGAIAISWAGLRFNPSTQVVLDVATVSEPPTSALLLLGVGALTVSHRSRRGRKLG